MNRSNTQATTADRFFIIDYETTGIEKSDVPIEVGIVITDSEWHQLDEVDMLIKSEYTENMSPAYWQKAEQIHNIPQREVIVNGLSISLVASEIVYLTKKWKHVNGRLILLSDNIQFEWRHTDWILSQAGYNITELFHYCGWDTSILSLFTPFRDPSGTQHRALPDAKALLNELQKTHIITDALKRKGGSATLDEITQIVEANEQKYNNKK